MKESDLIKLITDYLEAKRYFYYRQNSGAFAYTYKAKDKKERKGFYRFGTSGAPDIVVVKDGQYIGCEVKVGKNVLSPAQFDFGEKLEKAGGRYIVVRQLEDLIREL